MRIFHAIWAWLQSSFAWAPRRGRPLKTIHVEELPEVLDSGAAYVLGEGDYQWFVAMVCPCGCKATLQMSLLADANPKWDLVEHFDNGTITLQPSIWRTVGCRSHFFLRRGMIQWCPDQTGPGEQWPARSLQKPKTD
jgi:hypothetical protein